MKAVVTDRRSAVTASGLTLFVDGKRVRKVRFDGRRDQMTWTAQRSMSPGRHTVRLVAKDALGNRTVKTWRFAVRR